VADACGNTTVLGTYTGTLGLGCSAMNNQGLEADVSTAPFTP